MRGRWREEKAEGGKEGREKKEREQGGRRGGDEEVNRGGRKKGTIIIHTILHLPMCSTLHM